MDKLHLSLDDLQVQSFVTNADEARQRGTVKANGYTEEEWCRTSPYDWTCQESCDTACPQTWEETCGETCQQCNNEGSWWVTAGYSGCGYC